MLLKSIVQLYERRLLNRGSNRLMSKIEFLTVAELYPVDDRVSFVTGECARFVL